MIRSQIIQTYYEKYSKLVEHEQSHIKLRQLLKQLNQEVDFYLSKRKPIGQRRIRSVSQKKKIDILCNEQHNNTDIIKRMQYELNSTHKRITKIEKQSYGLQLQQKIMDCQEKIVQYTKEIENNRKITTKLGNEIIVLEEHDGQSSAQLEAKQLEKQVQDQKAKNSQLSQQLSQLERANSSLGQYRNVLDCKLQKYDNGLLQDMSQSDHYGKLQLQLSQLEKSKRIFEEKYQIDQKILKQDISQKVNRIRQLDTYIDKLNMEILQLNERLTRQRTQSKRSVRSMSQQVSNSQTEVFQSDWSDQQLLEQIQEQMNEQTINDNI